MTEAARPRGVPHPRTAGPARSLAAFGVLVLLLSGTGCGSGDTRHTITDVREQAASGTIRRIPATTADRFGFVARDSRSDPHARNPHGGNPHGGGPAGGRMSWTVPQGWHEVRAQAMRQASFKVDADPKADCSLVILPGRAGGATANVNRWRGQMGLNAVDAKAIAELPRHAFLGGEAILVELTGAYKGMGTKAEPDFGLIGLVLEQSGRTVFLKMTGPAATVRAERGRFLELAKSVRQAAARPPMGGGGAQDAGIQWKAPAEWQQGRPRPMRVVTFAPKGAADTECYVTVLPGAAGGVGPNINRWRGQMGHPALDAEGLAKLPRISVMGQDSPLLEASGPFTGMNRKKMENAGLLGVVCPLGRRVLFVKMTGPADVVRREKERFIAFCASLRSK